MECITEEIRGCIIQGSFEGRPLHVIRGVKPCDLIFTDQDELQTYLDKYTTGLYSANEDVRSYELQPIPDYLQWFKTSQLHYLSLEERMLPFWPWDDIYLVYIYHQEFWICVSVCCNAHLMTEFTPIMDNTTRSLSSSTETELERARWQSHQLYKSTTKLKLEAIVQRTKNTNNTCFTETSTSFYL